MRSPMVTTRLRLAVVLLAQSFAVACGAREEGLVVMIDDTFQATLVASSNEGFSAPDGVIWRAGRFYLADEGGSAIKTWSQEEGLCLVADSRLGLKSPEDLVVDADGTIFATDDDAGGLWQIDPSGHGSLIAGREKGLISTEGIALAADGAVLVGDGRQHQIYRVTRSGEVSVFLGTESGIMKPESLAFDDERNLYIADNEENVLYQMSAKHGLIRLIEHRNGFSPETISYFRGALYITDSQAGTLYRYRPTTGLKAIAVFGGSLRNIQGVTFDDQGNIFVSVQSNLKRRIGSLIKLAPRPEGRT